MPQPAANILWEETISTPLGLLVLSHDGTALCNIEFADQDARRQWELKRHFPGAALRTSAKPSTFAKALKRYFDGDVRVVDGLPVAAFGTPFQNRVWRSLRKVPPGATCAYGDLAQKLRMPQSARAVGRANGLNPVSIVVPCHRLVGSDGDLVHYGGGLDRKRWLIEHEAKHAKGRAK